MIRRIVILLGALAIVGAIGLLVWNTFGNVRAAKPAYSDGDMVTIKKGALTATVSATGTIEPADSTEVAFLNSGNVAQVLVKRGDRVERGQVLAKLDSGELEIQLAQAEANLKSAEANLAKLQKGASASAISAAQSNLTSAQAAYNQLQKPEASEIGIAKADVDKTKAALDQAQAAYDRIGGASNPYIGLTSQALQLQTATLDYQKAVDTYNSKFTPSDSQLKSALAQIQSAKDQLDRLNPNVDDIAGAQANVDSSRAARDLAKQRLSEATLLSPRDGTLTVLNLDQGGFVQAGRTVATIADLDHLRINIDIDETDIPRVQIGQAVLLDLDAFPGQAVKGTVDEIAPAASTVQGVVNYEVKIGLQDGQIPVRVGMTANANIEVASRENVLLVPNRAIRAEGSQRLVTILENGQPKDVTVTLGLSNDQETEVLDGLAEGQQVLTIAIPSNVPAFGGGNNNRSN